MRKFIAFVALVLVSMAATAVYAQQVPSDSVLHAVAVQALKENKFVVEADRLIFKQGDVAYVNSNTNFIKVDGEKGTVQVAFNNTPFAGPNGIGGITVDGRVSGIKVKESKRGIVTYSFNVQGSGISAQVFLTLNRGNNQATVNVSPNFNSRNLTLSGELVPLEESTIFKARSF